MPFEIPTLADLIPDKGPVLALAAQVAPSLPVREADPATRARVAAWRAYQSFVTKGLAEEIERTLAEVLQLHELMDGERADAEPAAWDAALDARVAETLYLVRNVNPDGFDKFALGVRLDQPDRGRDVAETLASFIAATPPFDRATTDWGKTLAAVGIVKADLDGLAALTGPEAPPEASPAPPPVTTPAAAPSPPTPSLAAPPGAVDLTGTPPPPPEGDETVENPDPTDMRPPPSQAEVCKAFALMFQAAAPDAAEMASRLGISRNTFVNWCTGRTRAQANGESARFLRACCEKAAGDMAAAAEIFSRVR